MEKETPSEKVGRMIKEENSMAPKFAILNKQNILYKRYAQVIYTGFTTNFILWSQTNIEEL